MGRIVRSTGSRWTTYLLGTSGSITVNSVISDTTTVTRQWGRTSVPKVYNKHHRNAPKDAIYVGRPKFGQNKRAKHALSNLDSVNRMAICLSCGPTKIISRGNGRWRCYTDSNTRAKLWKRKKRQLKKDQLGPRCVICGSENNLVWDHCHSRNVFRGTLCRECNTGLGMFKDSPFVLRIAAEYLDSFNNPEDYV